MTFEATVVALLVAATVAAYGQVIDIASDLDTAGRNFSCTGEVVTYTCSGQGTTLSIDSPPLLSRHIFSSIDDVPDAVPTPLNAVLTLNNRVINASGTFYAANLQITMPSDEQQKRINISCATNVPGPLENFVLPLIHESPSEPPFNVMSTTYERCPELIASRSVRVSWTPPVNPQFDIEYYLVRIYVGEELDTTRTSRNNIVDFDIDMPAGRQITADVRTVTTCGSISTAQPSSNELISENCPGFYTAFLIPTIIGFSLLIIVLVLAIFLVRARTTISKFQQLQQLQEKGVEHMTSAQGVEHMTSAQGVEHMTSAQRIE